MKCVICNSVDIVRKKVDEEIKHGMDVVLVQVETPVCANCGERYYDRRTMLYLEEVEENIRMEKVGLQPIGKVMRIAGM
ncbi:MAG: YgiT-type zinc finger protein [Deltaproteobacteria bacterium]|nr:YgiT-type zinc finger protein [Deltaproteobacteria bacterium]